MGLSPSIFTCFLLSYWTVVLASCSSGVGTKGPCSDVDTEWGRVVPQCSDPNLPRTSDDGPADEEVEIAIIGGGLVGLAVAIGLTQNGVSCRVYERSPRLRSVSQGILAVKPVGMQALEDIHPGIVQKVLEFGCERLISVLTEVDANGNVTETIDEHLGRDDEAKYGRKRVGITWHNMQQVLASMLPSNIVKTGRSLSSFEEEDNAVLLRFVDGGTVRAKAALMCDGVFSVGRREMFPSDHPVYFGQLNWGSVVKTDSLPPALHPPNAVRYVQFTGDPKWMAMLNDGGGGYTFFQLRVSDPEKGLALSGSQGRGGLGLPGAQGRLLPIVKPCKDVSLALGSIPESRIFERSIIGRLPAAAWLSPGKRVSLVGDAAHGMHPNIGQGANTGFESARNLVKAMTECGGDWKRGLESFEKGHKPRADLIQQFANMMGCSQSTGEKYLPQNEIKQMLNWVHTNDNSNLPSQNTLEAIRQFDPFSQEGVSPIK